MPLKFDAMLPAQPLRQAAELGRRAADAGLSGLVVTEAGRTAYLTCGALVVAADIDVLTGIAVAFPRSPMVTAATAWELAEASGGPLPPGSRRAGAGPHRAPLRLGVRSPRAAAARVRHRREADLRVLPPRARRWRWRASTTTSRCCRPRGRPGPSTAPTRRSTSRRSTPGCSAWPAEVADGVHVHPLNTPTYLRETVLPNLEKGAARSGRTRRRPRGHRAGLPRAWATPTAERHGWRERARVQVAFYGSTPNYAFIFEQLDREGTTDLHPRAPTGGRPPRHGGRHRRRPAQALHHRGDVGRHRRRRSWTSTTASRPGSSATSPVPTSSRTRRVRALGRAGPTGGGLLVAGVGSASDGRSPGGSATTPVPSGSRAPRRRGRRRARRRLRHLRRRPRRRSPAGRTPSGSACHPPPRRRVLNTSSMGSSSASAGPCRGPVSGSHDRGRRVRAWAPSVRSNKRGQPVLDRVDVDGGRRQGSLELGDVLGQVAGAAPPGRTHPVGPVGPAPVALLVRALRVRQPPWGVVHGSSDPRGSPDAVCTGIRRPIVRGSRGRR